MSFFLVKNRKNFTPQKLLVIRYFISITLIYRYCTNIKYFTSIFVSGISSKLQSVPYHFSFLSVLFSNFLLTTKTLENINAIYSYIYMYRQINSDLDYLCVVITATYNTMHSETFQNRNFLGINFWVWNRQVFGLHRLN